MMRANRFVAILIGCVGALSGCNAAPQSVSPSGDGLPGEVSYFERKVYPRDQEVGDPIVIGYYGREFRPPIASEKVVKEKSDRSTLSGWLNANYSAWAADDVDWILAGTSPADRADIAKPFGDPQTHERIVEMSRKLQSLSVNRDVLYGDYHLLFMESLLEGGQVSQLGHNALIRVDGLWQARILRDRVSEILCGFLEGPSTTEVRSARHNAPVRQELTPVGQESRHAIVVKWAGKEFKPPQVIGAVTHEKQNLATPEGTLTAFYTASRNADTEWLRELFPSEEATVLASEMANQREQLFWMGQRIALAELRSQIFYGEYALMLMQHTLAGQPEHPAEMTADWFVLKRVGPRWLVTNEFQDRMTEYLAGGQRRFKVLGVGALSQTLAMD